MPHRVLVCRAGYDGPLENGIASFSEGPGLVQGHLLRLGVQAGL